MDFGFNSNSPTNTNSSNGDNGNVSNNDVTNINNGNIDNNANGEPADDINSISDIDNNNTNNDDTNNKNNVDNKSTNTDATNDVNNNADKDNNFTKLETGTSIEFEDNTYTVDNDGNLIDKDGKIFKEAKDVQDWLKDFDTDDTTDDDSISINNIQKAIGIDIKDDKDNDVVYDNTIDGIKSYVEDAINFKVYEAQEATLNSFFNKYPIVKDFLNYYIANGNSADGFNQVVDRSDVEIDDNNEAQQEYIIKTAWKEQGRKGDVEGYINYLKSSGTLLQTAKEELEGLKQLDAEYKQQVAEEAERVRKEKEESDKAFWNNVYNTVNSRQIAGYQIPESILITRNGQKISVTPNDFFNYISIPDKDGVTQYQRDLMQESPESRTNDIILRAYLKFVGGNYSNLVDMAINKQNVTKLRLKAKERNKQQVRITKPSTNKSNGAGIDFGYK